jgi:hypothetical protein
VVLHARWITLPNLKRGGLLIMKIKKQIQARKMIWKVFWTFFKRDFINMITWATTLQQRVQGGHSYKHPGNLDGN